MVTADRGLAGAYNQNVIQETMKRLEKHPDSRLFVVGGNGRHFFSGHGVPVEKSFRYDAQSPTLRRAREITAKLLDLFDRARSPSSLSSTPTLATAWTWTCAPCACCRWRMSTCQRGDGGKAHPL